MTLSLMPLARAEPIECGRAVRLVWRDGTSARFHAVWLRDNALDTLTRAEGNGQRLITALDMAPDLSVGTAAVTEEGDLALRFEPDGHETRFPAAWLAERIYDTPRSSARGWLPADIVPWVRAQPPVEPAASFAKLAGDPSALGRWLATIPRDGFATLHGVPLRNGAVCDVAALFGYVRETNYGRWFDVRAKVDPSNLADTSRGLQAHTDNPYRDPAPTLQLLHCLENAVEGGESIVVDGFAVARRLRDESPEAFDLLADHPMRFAYKAGGVDLQAKRPVIELGPDGELLAIRFNNRSAAAVTEVPYARMEGYCAATRHFATLIQDPAMAIRFSLEPGDLLIVDNTRVLHARTAFSGAGRRWLQGCYADKDGLLSRLRTLREAGQGTA